MALEQFTLSTIARLRLKNLFWPSPEDPQFVAKLTRQQGRPVRAPKFVARKHQVTVESVAGYPCFIITPHGADTTRMIYYLHGGAFTLPMSRPHWSLASYLATHTQQSVCLPAYPLVPQYDYRDIHHHIVTVYQRVLQRVEPEYVTVMGDSAGGTLALVLPLLVSTRQQPGRVMALSPAVDLTMENPQIDDLESRDPFLPLAAIRHFMPRYYTDASPKAPHISPLYADYTDVRSRISLMNAGRDLLSPDTALLHDKLTALGIDHDYLYEPEAFHAWPIAPAPSAKKARQQLVEWLQVS